MAQLLFKPFRPVIGVIGLSVAILGVVYFEKSVPGGVNAVGEDIDLSDVRDLGSAASSKSVLKMSVESGPDGEPLAAVYEVFFPDGSSSSVRMRRRKFDEYIELDSVADAYRELDAKAQKGDPTAALTLSQALSKCRSLGFQTEEKFRDALASLESQHTIPLAFSGDLIRVSPNEDGIVDVDTWSREIRKTYGQCKGLSATQVFKDKDFMQMAFDNGSLTALRNISYSLPPGKEKQQAFQKAWEQGDYNALGWLAKGYGEGWSGGGSDRVREYAFSFLFVELTKLAFSDREGVVDPFFERIRQSEDLDGKYDALTHEEYNQAIDLAKKTLDANNKCCMGLWSPENLATGK